MCIVLLIQTALEKLRRGFSLYHIDGWLRSQHQPRLGKPKGKLHTAGNISIPLLEVLPSLKFISQAPMLFLCLAPKSSEARKAQNATVVKCKCTLRNKKISLCIYRSPSGRAYSRKSPEHG
jgi:hypothetical protein